MEQDALFEKEPVTKADKKWRSAKIRRTRAEVQPHVDHIANALNALGLTYVFGGSWRRNCPIVGDLDVLVVVDNTSGIDIPGYIVHKGKDVAMQGDLTIDDVTIHLDVWTCKTHELGAYLWYFTGPRDLNVEMRRVALKKGLHLKQQGLTTKCPLERTRSGPQGGLHKCSSNCKVRQVDNGTEEDIARILGWPMMAPEEREAWIAPKQQKVESFDVQGSKGEVYKVLQGPAEVSCTCKGYFYRRDCKHIRSISGAA